MKQWILLLSLLACLPATGASDMPPEANRLQSDHLPTPYSAEEIRERCRPGYTVIHKVTFVGREPILRMTVFLHSEEDMAKFGGRELRMDGTAIRYMQPSESTWEELQSHASWPESRAEVVSETIEVPAGTFDCWKYTVTSPKNETTPDGEELPVRQLVAWFAKDLPGHPVKMLQQLDGQTVMAMELMETEMP